MKHLFQKSNQFAKGNHPKSQFKKGFTPWNKGKECKQMKQELIKVKKYGIHNKIRRYIISNRESEQY